MIDTDSDNFDSLLRLDRPSIFNEQDRKYWKFFNEVVENSVVEIRVNSMYAFCKDIIDSDRLYDGSGYAYYFWFKSETDKEHFLQELSKYEQ